MADQSGKRLLAVLETAYRATLEEQDDPIIWLTQALRAAGTDAHLLLRGNAVNYAVRGQDASGLRFGERAQTRPPRIDNDLLSLIAKGADVYYVADDLAPRGILEEELVPGVRPVPVRELPALFGRFEEIWHW